MKTKNRVISALLWALIIGGAQAQYTGGGFLHWGRTLRGQLGRPTGQRG